LKISNLYISLEKNIVVEPRIERVDYVQRFHESYADCILTYITKHPGADRSSEKRDALPLEYESHGQTETLVRILDLWEWAPKWIIADSEIKNLIGSRTPSEAENYCNDSLFPPQTNPHPMERFDNITTV